MPEVSLVAIFDANQDIEFSQPQISDNLIGLERNQQSEDGRSPTTIRILKNRYSGETGTAGELTYDINTCRFTENETERTPIFNPATDF